MAARDGADERGRVARAFACTQRRVPRWPAAAERSSAQPTNQPASPAVSWICLLQRAICTSFSSLFFLFFFLFNSSLEDLYAPFYPPFVSSLSPHNLVLLVFFCSCLEGARGRFPLEWKIIRVRLAYMDGIAGRRVVTCADDAARADERACVFGLLRAMERSDEHPPSVVLTAALNVLLPRLGIWCTHTRHCASWSQAPTHKHTQKKNFFF